MSMNFIDAAGVLADSAELLADDMLAREAKSIVQETVDAYDALAPDWSLAPVWAQWYAIDASGWRWSCMFEPEINSSEWFLGQYGSYVSSGAMPIPLGIDWRLLKWQRPEVAA